MKKKLKIVFLSPLDNDFWVGVRQGTMYAKKELATKNAEVEYLGFHENSWGNILNSFTELLDKEVDGFVIPGFGEEVVPLIEKASQKNIPVMTFNCDLSVPSKRISYFGPDINEAGILAADFMIKALNGVGNVAIIRYGLNVIINRVRTERIKEVIAKKKKISMVGEIEVKDNNEDVYQATKTLLERNPNIDGIFIIGGGVIGAAKGIKDLNMVGKTKIVCFDFNREMLEFIKEDIIYAAIGQDPFGQGHDPVIYIYNYLVENIKPESEVIQTRTDVVDKSNVDDLI